MIGLGNFLVLVKQGWHHLSPYFGFLKSAYKPIESWLKVHTIIKNAVKDAAGDTVDEWAYNDSSDYRKDLTERLKILVDSDEIQSLANRCYKTKRSPEISDIPQHLINRLNAHQRVDDDFTVMDLVETFRYRLTTRLMLADAVYKTNIELRLVKTNSLIPETRNTVICFENEEELRDPAEADYDALLDFCKDRLNEMRPFEAQSELAKLPEILRTNSSDNLRYRIALISGLCFLRQENYEKAQREFELAVAIRKASFIPWVNLAACSLALNSPHDALLHTAKALSLNTKSAAAAALRIQALSCLGYDDALKDFITNNKWVESYVDPLRALGQHFYDSGKNETAESYFARAVDKDNRKVDAYILKSHAIVKPIMLKGEKEDIPTGVFTGPDRQRLFEALGYLTTALGLMSSWDNLRPRWRVLLFRASIFKTIGKKHESLNDCKEAFQIDSDNDISKATMALNAFEEGNYDDAYQNLKVSFPIFSRQLRGIECSSCQ